jgi:hypothetical protein
MCAVAHTFNNNPYNRANKGKHMSNEVATQSSADSTIAGIGSSQGFYTSLQTTTRADKMAMLKAINNSTPLVEKAGSEISIVDVVMQSVEIANESTGAVEDAVRITLITNEGEAFNATSKGIAQSLKQAFGVLGTPDQWDEPLVVGVAEERGRNGFRYLTLKF